MKITIDTRVQIKLLSLGCTEPQIAPLEPTTIEVCNIKLYRSPDERAFLNAYIGRWAQVQLPTGMFETGLGNHHPISPHRCDYCGREHTRKECVEEFDKDLYTARHLQAAMWALATRIVQFNGPVKLWCHCSPLACHGDPIARRLAKHLTHLELA